MMPKESQTTRVRQSENRGHMATVLWLSLVGAVVAMLVVWAVMR